MKSKFKIIVIIFCFLAVVLSSLVGGALGDRIFGYKLLDQWIPRQDENGQSQLKEEKIKIVREESVVVDVVEKVSPSVVTVGVKKTLIRNPVDSFFDPFGFFSFPQQNLEKEEVEQDIGSGFIISDEGMVVTNKHVVADSKASYKVITKDDQELEVEKIYRDPSLDLAILKVAPPAGGLKPAELGDSSQLKVGQFVIAIGTALGEFRHTVTTGVVSGLGRGVVAGDPFGSYSEQLENVIQTDAAINPGNSGGPLLNSAGQVIGVNVAVSQAGENIGFALPIDVVKESLETFNKTGKFERPFLGIKYKSISRDLAILNEVPEGVYIVEVVKGSAADKAGIKKGDIIVKIDQQRIADQKGGLAKIIQTKKIGQSINLEVWRDGETLQLKAKLQAEE